MARIIIFGASGRTGHQLVTQALEAGNQVNQVTAFARNPPALLPAAGRLSVFTGNVLDREAVLKALTGQELVLSVLGPAHKREAVCAEGTRNILAGMKTHGLKRIVLLSAYGASETRNGGFYARVVWWTLKDKMQDKNEMEALVRASDLDWTLVRPPALTDGPRTNTVRHGTDVPVSLMSRISRADVAAFMLGEATQNHYLRQAPTLTA